MTLPQKQVTNVEIGRLLRKARLAKGLKVTAVAAQIGAKSHTHISSFENGKETPTLEQARLLEKALDISPTTLISMVALIRIHDATRHIIYDAEQHGVKMTVNVRYK